MVTAFTKQIKPEDKRPLVEFLDEQIKSNPSITPLEEPRTSQTL
ncbi:TPA: hypothetical protein ACTXW4_001825 [Legionella anisa]